MFVRCDQCQARYRIDDARVGPGGLTLRCGKCRHLFPAVPDARAAGGRERKSGPPSPAGGAARLAPAPTPTPASNGAAAGQPAALAEPAAAGAKSPDPRRRGRAGGRVFGLVAALAALLVALALFVAAKKADAGRPPDAALRTLAQARSLADQDAIALFPRALDAARAALAAADRAPFGAAHATAAEIELAWADALEERGDGTSAQAHRQAALAAATEGARVDPRSADVSLALADCYRAARATAEMDRELTRAESLHADPGRIALVRGLSMEQAGPPYPPAGPEGGAADRLRQAVRALPGSARAHYRLAQALVSQHKEKEALAEMQETIRLSPAHERARAQLEAMTARRRRDP
ncbi:MAG: hypothetical protein NVSMB23_04590 [Myxococcales bacterium]